MRGLRRAWRTTAAAAAAMIVLTSCTSDGGSPSPADGPGSTQPSPRSPTESTPPAPSPRLSEEALPPDVGACYDLDFDSATEPTNDKDPVSCRKRHTAQTYHVGRLDTVVDGHLLAVDSERAQDQLRAVCPAKLAAHVGGTRRDRRLSRLQAVWFSPTLAQSDEGASWFRCDVVGLGRGATLAPLPPPRILREVLDRDDGLDRVGLCGTAAPGTPRFDRVICSRRHTWRALTTIDLAGGRKFPGRAEVRRAGEERCRNIVRRASGSPDRFRYGWEWPSRDQWRAGQHYGYCWAPD